MDNQNELKMAWIAGFVDGDGCLTISRQTRKSRPSDAWRPMITITNTNKESLEYIKLEFGGTLSPRRENKENPITHIPWLNSWCWYCPQGRVIEFCTRLMPYLIIKRLNAEILILFMHHLRESKREKGGRNANGAFKGSSPLSVDVLKVREKMRNDIQSLNSRKGYHNG